MPEMPGWMEALTGAVADCLTVHGPEAPLGLRFRQDGDVWDVQVYPLPVEVVGGAHDGGLAAVGFEADLDRLRAAFGRVDAVGWDAHGSSPANADEGPCVWVEGEVAGRRVWLRLLASAPEGVAPAARVGP